MLWLKQLVIVRLATFLKKSIQFTRLRLEVVSRIYKSGCKDAIVFQNNVDLISFLKIDLVFLYWSTKANNNLATLAICF